MVFVRDHVRVAGCWIDHRGGTAPSPAVHIVHGHGREYEHHREQPIGLSPRVWISLRRCGGDDIADPDKSPPEHDQRNGPTPSAPEHYHVILPDCDAPSSNRRSKNMLRRGDPRKIRDAGGTVDRPLTRESEGFP